MLLLIKMMLTGLLLLTWLVFPENDVFRYSVYTLVFAYILTPTKWLELKLAQLTAK